MGLNRTSEWIVMTIWISRELPLFNFERLDILFSRIGHPNEKLWPFEFLEKFCYSISSVSIYYANESDIRVKSYDNLNFSIASVVLFQASQYIMSPNRTSVWILWPFQFLEIFRCSISSVSIYYANESDIQTKGYDHLNFSRASVVPFWACRHIISPNWTSKWKVMTIWTSWELFLFNYERLDILCAWIGHPSQMFWPLKFLESFRCSISSVSICYGHESDIRVKSYDHLNF